MKDRQRISISHSHDFDFPAATVFELACPVKEDQWLPGWKEQREILYSKSGKAEHGLVFKTIRIPDLILPATWIVNVYEPPSRIQYAAFNEKLIYQIQWDFGPKSGGCHVTIERTWTALDREAENHLKILAESMVKKHPDLFGLAEYYLINSTMKTA